MEKARQHSAVTAADWLAIGGKAVALLCVIGMLVSLLFVGGSLFELFAAAFCLAAVFVLLVRLCEGLSHNRVRWSDYVYRAEKPLAFWGVMAAVFCTLGAYAAAFLFVIEVV